jgi:thiol-disulfide isomerase/thioredoxin
MRPALVALALALGISTSACARAPTVPAAPSSAASPSAAAPSSAPTAPSAAPAAAAAPVPRLAILEGDYAAALARARAEDKALFVDVWAPWCHTCLSVRAEVLADPSIARLGERAVFVVIDSDRPESAPFLEAHAVTVWPTFFVIDPKSDRSVGFWPGGISARELVGFVDESVAAMWAGREGSIGPLASAREASAKRDHARAAKLYGEAAGMAAVGALARSEALVGWIHELRAGRSFPACVEVGRAHLDEVRGAAMPADFAGYLLDCADELPRGPVRDAARAAVVARLEALAKDPPADASVDDRADALGTLAEALASSGDAAGARAAHERRLALLEAAAAKATTPEGAAVWDYLRATTYLALGRAPEAVAMLEARAKALPGSYETAARLADVLAATGRTADALAAEKRAVALAYGPRKLRYLAKQAELELATGDRAAAIATLEAELRGWESLGKGQASPERTDDARRRLVAVRSGKGLE